MQSTGAVMVTLSRYKPALSVLQDCCSRAPAPEAYHRLSSPPSSQLQPGQSRCRSGEPRRPWPTAHEQASCNCGSAASQIGPRITEAHPRCPTQSGSGLAGSPAATPAQLPWYTHRARCMHLLQLQHQRVRCPGWARPGGAALAAALSTNMLTAPAGLGQVAQHMLQPQHQRLHCPCWARPGSAALAGCGRPPGAPPPP